MVRQLFVRDQPKIKLTSRKREGYDGWVKCGGCHESLHEAAVQKAQMCCPKCGHHFRLSVEQRLGLLIDPGTFIQKFSYIQPTDPLGFVDTDPYPKRLAAARKKGGRDEAVLTGLGKLQGVSIAIAILDFGFMGGSMGSVVGERLTSLIELAIEERVPLLIVSASGGARMQESIFSLMQMAKTSAAIAKFNEAGLPYISLLTDPTMGGVTASFATLGDIIIAEPGALIGFAGPRVIEQTMGTKLPPDAQRSEFLLERGMIDCIVNRHDLKRKLHFFFDFLTGNGRRFEETKRKKRSDAAAKLRRMLEREPNRVHV